MGFKKATTLFFLVFSVAAFAQNTQDLVLEDPEDIQILLEEFPEVAEPMAGKKKVEAVEILEQPDDLEALREDLGDIDFILPQEDPIKKEIKKGSRPVIVTDKVEGEEASLIFDVGKEEKDLLELAKNMMGKIPADEWNEIAQASKESSYTVRKGDWLWKISKKLFGSGFYYSKIWALNPYITNPHLIEPGMILTFDTGSQDSLPQIKVGGKDVPTKGPVIAQGDPEFEKWGTDAKPEWIKERDALREQGVYIQYSSAETQEDLKRISDQELISEYEAYEPPRPDFLIEIPEDQYDETGFDRSAKISFDFKQGFYLNTFISTNVVQDFGKVDAGIEAKEMFTRWDQLYLKFDDNIDVVAGDKFSIYTAQGGASHPNSDREGFRYTIVAGVQTVKKVNGLWLCDVIESAGVVNRGDRITVFTPKIERITTTFNNRTIEAVLMGSFSNQDHVSFGDVVYLDRGRADGVQIGNVFEAYGFVDRGTGKKITGNPTYKNGELTIISLTDNFATALVTQSIRDFKIGDIAITKTKEAAARAAKLKERVESGADAVIKDKALEELDVELNLEDINDALLEKADKIQFTEDELSELERQEREKSIMSEEEKDLKALERLESEIEEAEKMLKDTRLDEDKWLEQQNLDKIEKDLKFNQQESLNEIEENFGKRYLDENLNDKENPYGLTEFDIEEIDELLNTPEAAEAKQ